MAHIAVVGLGSMGGGIARSLVRSGFEVEGADPAADRRGALEAVGAKAVSAPEDAIHGADIILCVVVNGDQVEELLFGNRGIAGQLSAGVLFVSCVTMAPDMVRKLAGRLKRSGIVFVDAPISGGAARAESGQLSVMLAADDEAADRLAPILGAIAATVHRVGDEPGMGSAVKMVNQHLAGVHIAVACEAMMFAKAQGLDLRQIFGVVCKSAGTSWMFENRVPHLLDNDFSPRSAVDIFVKDLGIVAKMGRELDFELPLARAAHALFERAAEMGLGREDDAAVAKVFNSDPGASPQMTHVQKKIVAK